MSHCRPTTQLRNDVAAILDVIGLKISGTNAKLLTTDLKEIKFDDIEIRILVFFVKKEDQEPMMKQQSLELYWKLNQNATSFFRENSFSTLGGHFV